MAAGPHGRGRCFSAMLWKCSEPDVRRASSRRPRRRYASDAVIVQPAIALDRSPPRRRLATGRRSPAGSTTEALSKNSSRCPSTSKSVCERSFPSSFQALGLPPALAAGLEAGELHPGVVARVVDDVRRRVDQNLDDPRQAAVETPEQLGLVAEQVRSWWWSSEPSLDPCSEPKLDPAAL